MGKIIIGIIAILIVGYLLVGNRLNKTTSTIALSPTPVISKTETITTQKNVSSSIVTVTGSGFSPESLTVKARTKVVWENKSGGNISINSDPHPTHEDYPPLNLGQVEDGKTISLIFDKAGTYKYHNHLNPSQRGTIIVE